MRRLISQCSLSGWGILGLMALVLLAATVAPSAALTPPPGTVVTNNATASFSGANGYIFPQATSNTVSTTLSGAPLLRLNKSAFPDPVVPGAVLTYTLRYENSGNARATGVVLVDTLPAGVAFDNASAGGSYALSSHTVTWSLGILDSGTSGTVTVAVLIPVGLSVGSSIVNGASLACDEGAAATTTLSTTIGAGANLILEKTGSPATITPDGTIRYTLNYRNIGNAVSHQARITDSIPSETAYVEGSAVPAATISGKVLSWNLGDLTAGAAGTVSFHVRVSPLSAGHTISNQAIMISNEQTLTSNVATSAVSTQSLLFLKMDTPDPVRSGTNLTYTMEVKNTGTTPLTGVVLSDPLPVGTTFVSADGGGVLTAGGSRVDWAIGNLSMGQKQTFTLIVHVDPTLTQGHVLDNTATVVSSGTPAQTARVLTTVNARTPGAIEFHDACWIPAYGYTTGDGIYLQVTDADQNNDPALPETVTVVLTNIETGDSEVVVLTETGPDTGIFRSIGIPTSPTASPSGDGSLNVATDSRVQATYTDPLDASPVSTASALIDPLGIVFDSATGNPIAGVVVTLRNWDNAANACDPTSWPALPPGQVNPAAPTAADGKFAFPLVPAGDYCFEVTPTKGYSFPSKALDANLPAGFTIGNGSRGEKFTLSVGDPPLVRDIPLDPPAGQLTIAKSAGKSTAAIGDLIAYSLMLTNGGASPVKNITLTDVLPHGIQIIPGTSRLDGTVQADPKATGGRTVVWMLAGLEPGKSLELTYRVVVGPDALRGDGVNTARAAGASLGKAVVSNTASVKVKITGGIFTEKGTILGKIYLDRDGNRMQNQSGPGSKGKSSEPGIPNVALYLEDGTRVITDQNGKFSIPGMAPGSHVLRVDETTLPRGLTPVPLANRFLGDGASQFITMQAGGLFQADFAVKGDWTPPAPSPGPKGAGNKTTAPQPLLKKTAPGDTSEKTVPPSDAAEEAPMKGSSAVGNTVTKGKETDPGEIDRSPVFLPSSVEEEELEATTPKPGQPTLQQATPSAITSDQGVGATASRNGHEKDLPLAVEGYSSFGGLDPVVSPASSANAPAGEGGMTAPATSEQPASHDWEETIKGMSPDLAFLSPADGSALTRDRIRVILKAPLETNTSLSLNGAPVSAKQIGRKIDYAKGRVTIIEYVGIRLNAGEKNTLQAEIKDPFGIVRGKKQITVTAAGAPERIIIRTDKTEVPADGKSHIRITVEIRDRQDRIVPYAAAATILVSAGEIVEKDADPITEDHQIALQGGIGHCTIRAPRETGEAVIAVAVEDRMQEEKIFFSPNLRNLFLVGMGEIKLGHGQSVGDTSFLKDNTWFNDGGYLDGRGAFFLKGRIYGDYLLTAAYDSDKNKRDDLFRENDTTIDTEDKYPLYGDESKTGYEALSTDRLYLKLEKNRSSLLYGDYRTDLNDTQLSAYNRSFNGLKYELNTRKFKLRAFGSHTNQTQIMDALPGRGISGYYYLTRRPVVEGSERVVIEVRDRYRPDNVLSRESKGKGSDYEIDYETGAILFKEPVPSHNGDANPVYIVVSYESRTEADKYYIYGGRGVFQLSDVLEIGATGVVEEKAISDAHLLGTDLTLKLPRKTVFKAEYAQTKGVFEESGFFNWHNDDGWTLTVESQPLDRLNLSGYYRTLGDHFQNLSATDVSRGTTKYGLDAAYQFRPTTRLVGRYFDERDDLNRIDHRLAAAGVQTKFKKTKIDAEISHETSSETYTSPGTIRSPFDISQETPRDLTSARLALETELRPDLSLNLSHKHNLSGESYHMSQVGLNYKLTSLNRLYLREEYQQYQERDEMRTLFGVETQLIRNTVAFNEYRLADGADGARNQNVIGLRNKFLLGKGITGNISGEYLKTLSGGQRNTEPDALAASLDLEYLTRETLKASTRFEHRRELNDAGRNSYLGEVGLAYKLHPDFSLLMRERFFTEDGGNAGRHTTSRTMAGLAYRPLLTNRFNALAKTEYKHESNAAATPSYQEEAWIFSGEGIWQATSRLQFTGKYAGKLARGDGLSSYTDLISVRFLYDVTDRWDIGAEYRILSSHKVKSYLQGGAAEVGYRIVRNLWVAGGWSFDRFDTDLTGDSYQGEGPYLKLRVKFDENTLHLFRDVLPAGQISTQTASR